ncbi:MAG: pyridoxamine 5'-phosphate oxidase family protein [Armatimonadota bacterium]|nr:pyridoxamine 5'-phosphate oxidase family protein [Armatimonadota bacterium]MDR7444645.1 pyridoxamine 5'-phosphate oxidase family protein [Armatimonadota bacterium]MDR7569471.1 pyridoxamine 5'-phosphate oxidase family protein [Armatimonadota bacterium]MDR7613646.1 pyridoxamine 5'-phosphate oxidase family protein [Armatimonadota bacterium]
MTDPLRVLLDLLEENRVMTLATAGPEGPWAAPVLYAWEGTARPLLYFMSRLQTRHARDILRTPQVAAAIHPPYTRPLRGVQLSGTAEPLRGVAAAHALELYLARFPSARGRFPAEAVLAERSEVRFFRLTPQRIFVLSEAHFGWGVRREVLLEPERVGERASG